MKNENLNELIKVKKIKKENNDLKNNLKLYKKIKRAIIEICSKIELNLNYIYNETNEKSKNIKNSNIFYTIEKNNYIELIKEYKEKINNSQEEINIVMRLNNIDLLDNEINTKKKNVSISFKIFLSLNIVLSISFIATYLFVSLFFALYTFENAPLPIISHFSYSSHISFTFLIFI